MMSEPSDHRNWFGYGGVRPSLYRIFLIVVVLIVHYTIRAIPAAFRYFVLEKVTASPQRKTNHHAWPLQTLLR